MRALLLLFTVYLYFLMSQGEKNNGFDVLYHNMKHGQISTKELSDFIRERAIVEDTYAKSMTKLSRSASNFSQLGTFAPVWDVFKTSTDKLASCHLELVRKLQELIKEVQKYADEQAKAHKKTKEEVAATLEAVQNIQSISQALQKSKENYNAKTVEQERLRKEGATQKDVDKAGVKAKKATEVYRSYVEKYATAKAEFEQKMAETTQKFQDIEESHILHMKEIIQLYSQYIEETHVQIGVVSTRAVQPFPYSTPSLILSNSIKNKKKFYEIYWKITWKPCQTKPRKRKGFGIPGRRKEKDTDSIHFCLEAGSLIHLKHAKDNSFYSSSDSDDDDEPRKFHVEIKPVQPNNGNHQTRSSIDELKASIGNITLSPSALVCPVTLILLFHCSNRLASNDLLSLDPFGPSMSSSTVPARPSTPLAAGTIVPPPRPSSRPKLPAGKLAGINEIVRPFSPPKTSNASPPPAAPLARAESSSSLSSNASLSAGNTPTVGISRGPSPITLASQDSLPIAVAFTESVNAYFKGADPAKCIVKITGDMTLSFPSGIIKIFTSNPSPAVLSFKLKNTNKLEQILPNQQILYSDPSQSDSSTKDFWLNMQNLTAYLRKASEQNPAASYYNVDILKYQVASNGIQSTPLNLAVYWKCSPGTTDLRVDYRYNPESMLSPSPLCNVQVLVPVDGGVTNMQSLPPAVWNSEQNKSLWKLSDISEKSENEGSGSLRAKFDLSEGPSNPATLAVQFLSEGSTLSGVDLELVGTGYRLSLVKKRFATGRYMADC
uniref:FCH and mu domain containing endocytic adaptor 2 n=1 Tax=Scleropages formosus TaxID=113540 RepID=A0A8C9U6Q6_SCLFO